MRSRRIVAPGRATLGRAKLGVAGLGLAAVAAGAALAQTPEDAWSSGVAMQMREAIVQNGPGNQIVVSCGLADHVPSGISFRLVGKPPADGLVMVMFDGETPFEFPVDERGYVRPGCVVCDQLFGRLLEGFRTHQTAWVRFRSGLETTFPLEGAAEAIGDCPLQGLE